MKNIFPYLTLAILLSACGAAAPEGEIGQKKAELDSLKAAYKELGLRIKETETWIAENDSTVKRNLPAVTTFTLQPTTFEHYVQVHGSVKADKSADLYTMGGRVRRILVSEGDRVRKGQLLIDLDNDAVARQLDAAEAGAKLAKEVFEKQTRLWEQKIGSEIQYLQAKSQNEQAAASVAALREQVRLSNVTAPFDGTVDEIMVSVGDMTSPMAPVARVVDPSGARLEADVPESYLNRVKNGDPVRVEFPSLGDTLRTSISNVSKFIDPANRTFRITVRAAEGAAQLRPNLLSVIHVRDQVQDSALVVPGRTIQEDVSGNNYIFILDQKDGRTFTRKVMVERVSDYKGHAMIKAANGDNSVLIGAAVVDEGAKSVGGGQEVKIATTL
ncbi:MAG: efflux RND transporter periplasmic adaptor subunit [Flavobacteriales bacterium]|nr:efflux RND transporter periplasmic adaptor subunit [Flavobacteriales bacterium]